MANTAVATTRPTLTAEEFEQIIAFNAHKQFAAPYHDEPVNEFLEGLRAKHFPKATSIVDMLVNHLPYAFVDTLRDVMIDTADPDEAEESFRNFVKQSVENILVFEMSEY